MHIPTNLSTIIVIIANQVPNIPCETETLNFKTIFPMLSQVFTAPVCVILPVHERCDGGHVGVAVVLLSLR